LAKELRSAPWRSRRGRNLRRFDDKIRSASGPYTVTISSIDLANSLTFNAPQAALVESAGELLVDGALTVNSGFVSLNEANAFSNVAITGGTLAFGNTGALAAGAVVLNGGELLATANVTLNNALSILGPSTIAAAHGTALNENSTGYAITANTTVNIGSAGQDGTVLWHTNAATVVGIPVGSLNVQDGAFKAADAELSFLLTNVAQTTVDSGASIDLAGFSTTIFDLLGAGAVMGSAAPTTLTLGAANFSGAISGPLSLVADGAIILSGANTYTGTTTIKSGDSLQLGVGGATGSLGGGAISDGGTLSIDVGDAVTLTGVISGAGALQQIGTGVTSINTANTYAGGTTLSAGTLAIGNRAALGAGTLTVSNGELLGTASATFANTISLSTSGATGIIAAAPGATLSLTGALTLAGANTIDIGAPGQNGDILWKSTLGGPRPGISLMSSTAR
jgi:fibronectin-binding autotransporter adhesin